MAQFSPGPINRNQNKQVHFVYQFKHYMGPTINKTQTQYKIETQTNPNPKPNPIAQKLKQFSAKP